MIKIVYVLTGIQKPEYLNMLRISVASAIKQMPSIKIEIVSDIETADYLSTNHVIAQENVTVVAEDVPKEYSTVEKSRYLKTNLRRMVTGDFLYIDTDTIICDDLSHICPVSSVNLVLDENCLLTEQEYCEMIRSKAAKVGIDLSECTHYFNGGVIFAKDDEKANAFFRRWFEKWESTHTPKMPQDQFSLNAVNMEMGCIGELDGTWNCQLTATDKALPYFRNVKILHYLSPHPYSIYRLNEIDLMRKELTADEIEMIISAPEKLFRPFHYYADDSIEYQVMQGAQFHLAFRWYIKHPGLYNFFEKVLSIFRK